MATSWIRSRARHHRLSKRVEKEQRRILGLAQELAALSHNQQDVQLKEAQQAAGAEGSSGAPIEQRMLDISQEIETRDLGVKRTQLSIQRLERRANESKEVIQIIGSILGSILGTGGGGPDVPQTGAQGAVAGVNSAVGAAQVGSTRTDASAPVQSQQQPSAPSQRVQTEAAPGVIGGLKTTPGGTEVGAGGVSFERGGGTATESFRQAVQRRKQEFGTA